MNMDVIYIVFGIVFILVILAAIGVGAAQIVVTKKRSEIAKRREQSGPIVIESEDLTIRIRGGVVEAFDTVDTESAAAAEEAEEAEEEPVPVSAGPVGEEETEREGVFLARGEKLTFAEKLARLAPETQALLEAFCSYVEKQPDCERLQQASAIALRYKKAQIAKVAVRRDCVVLNFAIVNPDLGRMMKEEKGSSLKLKPVEIRLTDEETLGIAKQTADITIAYLKQEEEYRLEKRKEARREAAKRKREEAAVTE